MGRGFADAALSFGAAPANFSDGAMFGGANPT
jgi:hypothetical protein